MDVARQQGLPNNLAITEYAYVSVAIFRSLQANKDAPEGPVAGMRDYAAVYTIVLARIWYVVCGEHGCCTAHSCDCPGTYTKR